MPDSFISLCKRKVSSTRTVLYAISKILDLLVIALRGSVSQMVFTRLAQGPYISTVTAALNDRINFYCEPEPLTRLGCDGKISFRFYTGPCRAPSTIRENFLTGNRRGLACLIPWRLQLRIVCM